MNKRKRQIIFLWPYLEWGGAQVYMLAIMKEAKADWDVIAVLPRASSPEMIGFLDQFGIKYHLLDFHTDSAPAPTIGRKLERQWNRIRNEFSILRFLRGFDLPGSILHIDVSPWQSWQFLTILSLRGANVFVTMHNAVAGAKWREAIWKLRMQFVSRLPGFHIFTSNKHTKDGIRKFVERNFWEKVRVTYTCVDPEQIATVQTSGSEPAELRTNIGLSANDFVVLSVGQFIDRKGRWVFLDAAKILAGTPDIKFVWITPMEATETERQRIDAYKLTNFHLILSNSIGNTREELLGFFRIGDVFALPSYVEGLPIALLEAMALGIAPISTSVYAIPEAVIDRQTGLLIDAGDSQALARSILELKSDPQLRASLARDASRFVLENFDERVASRIAISAYKECFPDAD